VSDWLLFNAKWTCFSQLYHGENKLHSMRLWWCLVFTWRTRLAGFPSYWNNRTPVDMSLHSDILYRFRANQSLLCLFNSCVLSGEAFIYQFYNLWFNQRPTAFAAILRSLKFEYDHNSSMFTEDKGNFPRVQKSTESNTSKVPFCLFNLNNLQVVCVVFGLYFGLYKCEIRQ
jgi:hypothetical protein